MTLARAVDVLNRFAYRGWNDWRLVPGEQRRIIPKSGETWLLPSEAREAAQNLIDNPVRTYLMRAKTVPNEARTP